MKQIFALIGSLTLLSACAVGTGSDVKASTQTFDAPKTVKPGAAVDFSYSVSKDLLPAEYGKVTLSFIDGYEIGTLRLQAQADDGLRLVSEVTEKEFSMAGSSAHEWELDVTAAKDGVYYLSILATVDLPYGRDSGRAFSARIEVGDIHSPTAHKSLKQNGRLSSDGTTVVLEAEEVIQ